MVTKESPRNALSQLLLPKPPNEEMRLKALARYRILDTPYEKSYDDMVLLAATICDTPTAAITLIDDKRQWFKAAIGLNSTETPRDQAFCAYTIMDTKPLIVEDAREDERFAENPLVTAAPFIRFYAGAPLITGDGCALGSICVVDQKPREITPSQQNALEALARQVMLLLEYRESAAQLAEAIEQQKVLHGLLPMCSHCKGVRHEKGYWERVEQYLVSHSEACLTHSICPTCLEAHHPEIFVDLQAKGMV